MEKSENNLLEVQTLEELLLTTDCCCCEPISQDEVTHILRLADCFWLHSGDPKDPHVVLTSDKCSNGFVNVLVALSYTQICNLFAAEIADKIEAVDPDLVGPKTWVVGSAYAALGLAQNVAHYLGARHAPLEKGPNDSQIWQRFQIAPDETVIQVEELITTLKTISAVRQGIIAGNQTPVRFAPFVATIVHRSPVEEFEGGPILRLTHYDIETWEHEVCPLCAQGSERIKPKMPVENWLRLTGKLP
ncbi:MAG: hypothetical protein Q8Q05_00855 [bacterium]|nr:hypothetical protein [bacterium]